LSDKIKVHNDTKKNQMATEVQFYSSSHGMPHRGLKKVLLDKMKLHQQRFQPFTINGKCLYISILSILYCNVLFLAQSGRKMTNQLAEQIINDVNERAGRKQIIIIGIGGNDLRPKGVIAGYNVKQLVNLHKKIVAHVEATEGYIEILK
jgi:hypothetical protein